LRQILDRLEPPLPKAEPFLPPKPPAEPTHARRRRRQLRGISTFTRDEMKLAGYPDDMPEIDACAGVE
jgi:hypothetical protein